MALSTNFHEIGEVEVDSRDRIALGKVPGVGDPYRRYAVSVDNDTGEIRLEPRISISPREAAVLNSPAALKLIREGLANAAKGNVVKGRIRENRMRLDKAK